MKTVEVAGDKTVTNFQNHNYIQHLKKEDKNWKEIIKYKSNKVVWVFLTICVNSFIKNIQYQSKRLNIWEKKS